MIAFSTSFAFASFPVQRTVAATENTQVSASAKKHDKKDVYAPVVATEKSQGIALILALLLGIVAAHRWYLGTPWPINVIFILTLGGLGIWWLIDIIRICTGDLGPVNGRYKESFF